MTAEIETQTETAGPPRRPKQSRLALLIAKFANRGKRLLSQLRECPTHPKSLITLPDQPCAPLRTQKSISSVRAQR